MAAQPLRLPGLGQFNAAANPAFASWPAANKVLACVHLAVGEAGTVLKTSHYETAEPLARR